MGGDSDYWENKILDWKHGKGGSAPAKLYVALSTTDPTDTGAGISEPVGMGYARIETAPADWTAGAAGQAENANDIVFGPSTGNWGTIAYFARFDAASGGNMIDHGALDESQAVTADDEPTFSAGDLKVTQD